MDNSFVNPSNGFISEDFRGYVVAQLKASGIEIHKELILEDCWRPLDCSDSYVADQDEEENWLESELKWESNLDNWSTRGNKYRKYGEAYLFKNEDGSVFQALVNWSTNPDKKHGYLAPKNVGDVPFFPSISATNRQKINNRFQLREEDRVDLSGSFWEKFDEYSSLPLVVTEGAKKCLALIGLGIPAISLFGCYCGVEKATLENQNKKVEYQLKETLKRFCMPGRSVIIALDNDSKPETKRKVAIARNKLFQALKNHGCKPSIMSWSADFKGIDDLIVGDLSHFNQRFEESMYPQKKSSLTVMHEALLTSFGSRIRYNQLKNVIELDGEKLELDSPKCWWNGYFGVACSTDDVTQTLLDYALQNQYHPVKNWLESLPPADCSQFTLDNLSTHFLGTDNPIFDLYLKKTLIAAVARVFEPGCKVDTVLVLQGAQGIGKSTFLSSLAVNPEWFDDSLSASTSSEKDEKLKIHHSWILELAELEALFGRKEIATVRSLISSSVDVFRRPYARETVHFKRQSIFVASVNPQHFLMDEEGNRRFLVVPVDAIQLPTPKQVEQIWKLALDAYKQGKTWWLSRNEEQMQSALNRGFESQDVWESAISNWLPHHPKPTTSQILIGAIELELNKQDKRSQSRITAIMKRLGYCNKQIRSQGERIYVWTLDSRQNTEQDTEQDSDKTPSKPVIEPVSGDFEQSIKKQQDSDKTPSKPVIEPVSDLRTCLSCQNSEKSTGISNKIQKELIPPPVISSSLANGLASLPPEQKCTNSGYFGNDLTRQTRQESKTQSQSGLEGVLSVSCGNKTDKTDKTDGTKIASPPRRIEWKDSYKELKSVKFHLDGKTYQGKLDEQKQEVIYYMPSKNKLGSVWHCISAKQIELIE